MNGLHKDSTKVFDAELGDTTNGQEEGKKDDEIKRVAKKKKKKVKKILLINGKPADPNTLDTIESLKLIAEEKSIIQ